MSENNAKQIKPENHDEAVNLVLKTKNLDDRSSVIILVAYIDSLLTRLMSKKLVSSLEDRDELLDDNTLFGSFGIKLKLAYRLGLISPDFYKTLRDLSIIRNKCAHTHDDVVFDQDEIKQRIENIVDRMSNSSHAEIKKPDVSTKEKFEQIFIGSYLLLRLTNSKTKPIVSALKEPMFE